MVIADRANAPAGARRVVSIKQAMQLADVCRPTIYNWLNSGKLEYVRTAGGQVRIFEDSLWRPGEQDAQR